MNAQKTMTMATVSLGLLGCLCAAEANAGCGVPDMVFNGPSAVAVRLASQGVSAASVAASLNGAGATQSASQLQGNLLLPFGKAVVGMWKFTFVSQGNAKLNIPDGAILDAGYQSWHDDGTEITNSGRPPMTGSFCTGVWNFQPNGNYSLNHYALSWDSSGTQFIGPTNIREKVRVDYTGNKLSGTLSIDQYAQDGVSLLMHLNGTVVGTRINPN